MNNAADTIEVNGSVTFGGGDETNSLTAGVLYVSGNFTQTGPGTTFIGSGSHTPSSSTAPAPRPSTSPRRASAPAGSRTSSSPTAPAALGGYQRPPCCHGGTAGVTPTAVRTLSGNGSTLFTTILNVSNFTFNNLLLNFAGSTVVTFDTVSFTGYAPTATPLTITHPGAAAPLPFQDVSFSVVPTSGFYLDATDSNPSDGVPLVIDMLNPNPLSNGGRVQTSNATVNWPAGVAPGTWTGAVSTAWTTAGNWSDGQVPTATTDVTIPAGPSNMPVLGTSTGIQGLTLQPGAALTLVGTMTLTLTGDLDDAGNLTSGGGGTQTIALTGAARTVRTTNIPSPITVNVSGTYTLAGRMVVTDLVIGTGGGLALGGQTLVVTNLFNTTAGGTLTMTNPLDSVLVTGTANFGGGDETGLLTAGVLQVGGSLTQSGNAAALAASGTHKTRLTGANPTLSIQSPGPGAGSSHLQELEWVGGGTLSLQSGAYVLGTTTLPAGGTLNGVSFTQSLHTGLLANGAPVTFSNAQLWIEPGAAVPVALNDLIFTSGSSSRLYLRHPGLPAAAPLTLTNIAFTTVPPFPGVYLDVDDITPLDNNAVVVNLFNPTPAASGGLVNATNGAVVNWPAATPVFTWTGAVSGDWSVAGNWSSGSVPGATNDVFIPAGTPNAPTLSATVAVDSLVLATSATVDLAGHFLQVFGDLDAPAGLIIGTPGVDRVIMAGAGKRLSGASIGTDLVITGRTLLNGGTGVSGSVTVSDTLDFQTGTLLVSGDFIASGPAALLVQAAGGALVVNGNATFDGPNQLGSLSNGVIAVGGNFTQLATNSPDSYHPSGTHQTVLNLQGPATTVTFATPGSVPGSSHFEALQLNPSATHTVTLGSDVHAHGLLSLTGPGTLTITGSNRLLSVGDVLQGTATVFDNVRLASTDVSGILSFQQPLTFQNMNPTVTQLSLTGNGAFPVTLTNAVFSTTPTGGGLYLSATDADGPTPSPFVVDLVNPTPATAGGFTQAINGAVINWPAVAGAVTWTGAVNTDWDTPGNWSGGTVPGPTSDVVIPAGPANQPLIASSPTVNKLTVQAGAILGLGDVSLTVTGALDAPGLVQGCCTDVVQVLGTVRGNFSDVTFTVPAGATATLNGTVDLGTASNADIFGELILSGNTLNAGQGSVNIGAGTGLLTMTNSGDFVQAGFIQFGGGDETGHLTSGVIQTQSLGQAGPVPTSLFASGNHRVVLGGPSTSTLFMADPVNSRLQDLNVTGVSATLTLLSNVTVAGQLISTPPSGSGPVVSGAGSITAGGADLTATGSNTALTFDGVPLILSGGLISAFDHVAFANQNPVGTALTVNNVGSGVPFTFDALTFSTALSAGGFHLVANDLDGPSVPLVIDVVNSIPAAGAPFFQANNGAVVNWPPAAPVVTWTGAVSSDWFNAGNWSTGQVPALTDDVLIPAGPTNAPVLSGTATIRDLTIAAGAPTIEVASFALVVTGNLNSDGTILSTPATGGVTLSGFAKQLRGTFDQATLLLNGDYSLSGRLATTAGTGIAIQAPGALQLNGHTADVGGPFTTSAGGLLVMINSLDSLIARGGAVFAGGDESALLNAGVLVVTGDLIQSGGNPAAFAPSGSHKTVLNATAAGSVVFTNAPSSHLHLTEIAAPGGISLGSRAVATADVTVTQGQLDLGGNALVVSGDFSTSGTGTVRMVSPQDSIVAVNQTWAGGDPTGNITAGTIVATGNFIQGGTAAAPGFTAAGSNVVRLEGGASALTTVGSNLTTVFASLELATTGPLTVTGANTFNVDGTGTLQLLTPAAVTYNNGGRGALSFSGGTFTAVGSSVIAPSVELFPGSSIQGGWTVDTTMWNQGAALSLQVPKTIPYNHLVLRNGNNFFFDSGTWSIPGDLITRVVNAATVRLSDQSGIPTKLTVGGNTQIFGQFLVASGKLTTGSLDVATLAGSRGFLSMLSIADSVTVLGNANFNGGSTNGLLTAGVLRVNGNFTQGGASSVAAFAPSGTHLTRLGSAAATTATFASPGAGAAGSHFKNLDLTAATGGVTLGSNAIVDSAFAVSVGAGAPKLFGAGNSLTARQWQVQGLTVDNAPLILNDQGGVTLNHVFNGVTFQGFPTTPTSVALMDITAFGSAAGGKFIDLNNTQLQTTLGTGGLYLRAASGNGIGYTVRVISSNDPTGGASRSQAIAPASILYQ